MGKEDEIAAAHELRADDGLQISPADEKKEAVSCAICSTAFAHVIVL